MTDIWKLDTEDEDNNQQYLAQLPKKKKKN